VTGGSGIPAASSARATNRARAAEARPGTVPDAEATIVPISALEHHAYCPRQGALIHVDGRWVDNEHTVHGSAGHARVDSAPSRIERGARVLRHIPLWSERYGLSGRADVVAVSAAGDLTPVEYKIGTPHGDAARIQLCAQALCLEEMFGRCVYAGSIWYSAVRRRTRVAFDDGLREGTLTAVTEVRLWMSAPTLPPATFDRRCQSCQFLDYCQPELSSEPDRVTRYVAEWVRCAS